MTCTSSQAARAHYLDTSALVRILVDEEGSEKVRSFFNSYSTFCTTSICFAEVLGILKAKRFYRKSTLGETAYLAACNKLMVMVGNKIEIDEVPINQQNVFAEVESFMKTYKLDVADAFQLVAIKRGQFSVLRGDSRSLLITADKQLAKAAREEKIPVWDCLRESYP